MTSDRQDEFPAVVGFLDQDYHYKSVAIHIPHDSVLTQLHFLEDRNGTAAYEVMALFMRYGGGHITKQILNTKE